MAARNILKLVKRAEHESESRERLLQQLPFAPYAPHAPSAPTEAAADEDLELQKYVPGAPAIKVSLGLVSPPLISPLGTRTLTLTAGHRRRACTSSRA